MITTVGTITHVHADLGNVLSWIGMSIANPYDGSWIRAIRRLAGGDLAERRCGESDRGEQGDEADIGVHDRFKEISKRV